MSEHQLFDLVNLAHGMPLSRMGLIVIYSLQFFKHLRLATQSTARIKFDSYIGLDASGGGTAIKATFDHTPQLKEYVKVFFPYGRPTSSNV